MMQPMNVPFTELVDAALERKAKTGTWKEWCWPPTGDCFTSQEAFRAFLFKNVYHIERNPDWATFLPRELHGTQREVAAEAAMRARISAVWKEVTAEVKKQTEQVNDGILRPIIPTANTKAAKRTRPTQDEVAMATKAFHIEMIIKMMAALSKENDLIYQLVALPLVQLIVLTLREGVRETVFQVRLSRPGVDFAQHGSPHH